MAMQYYHRNVYRQYLCPNCNGVLKSESVHDHRLDYGNDGCIMFLCYLVFPPITLLYLLIKLIVKLVKEKKKIYCEWRRGVFLQTLQFLHCVHSHRYARSIKGRYKKEIKR